MPLQIIDPACDRFVGGGSLREGLHGLCELVEPGCECRVDRRYVGRRGDDLREGGVDPSEVECETGHARLQGAQCLLGAPGDALEAVGQRRERRLDSLRAGNGGLDALGEICDPALDVPAGLARPDALGQLGDRILEPGRVLVIVVRLLRRRWTRRRRRHRKERDRRALIGPLLGECARELHPGDRPLLDEDLAERLPRLLLFEGSLRQRLLSREPELEQNVADAARLAGGGGRNGHGEPPRSRIGRQERTGRSRTADGPTAVRIGMIGVPLAHSSQGRCAQAQRVSMC